MIPKKIHYCWFGGAEIPERDRKCIESWKKYCPDYEIVCWNESNYDVTKNRYIQEAYQAGKWGFVSDYARLDVVYEHGGIYLDTDVELIRNLDALLNNRAYMGFERDSAVVNTGHGFGAEKDMPLLYELKETIYHDRRFRINEYELDTTPCPKLTTDFLISKGLRCNNAFQIIDDMVIYPADYFCPIDFSSNAFMPTENTYSIHHYHASWLESEEKEILIRSQALVRKYGIKKANFIGGIIFKPLRLKMHLRTKGVAGTTVYFYQKIKKRLS